MWPRGMAVAPFIALQLQSVKYEVSNSYDHYAFTLKKRLPQPDRITRVLGGRSYAAERALSDSLLHHAPWGSPRIPVEVSVDS